MKKPQILAKPFLVVIFGALLLLFYLNWLSFGGAALALGIIALVISAFYLVYGIFMIFAAGKLSESAGKIMNLCALCAFPVFTFVYFLIMTINAAGNFGPNGWVIALLSMISSLGLAFLLIANQFAPAAGLTKLLRLCGIVFSLALLLSILFDAQGNANNLGEIDIITTVIDGIFVYLLFQELGTGDKAAPKESEETSAEEPAEEESGSEEA